MYHMKKRTDAFHSHCPKKKKHSFFLILSLPFLLLSGCMGNAKTANSPSLPSQEADVQEMDVRETNVLETNAPETNAPENIAPKNPSAKNIEFKNKALTAYREFLTTKDWHSLTATDRYPRGDSRSSYAFVDCNGDQMPELCIDGGNIYHIYTFRNQKVELLYDFDDYRRYSSAQIQPLADGSFLISHRLETCFTDPDVYSATSSNRKIPQTSDAPLPEEGGDIYEWISLTTEENKVPLTTEDDELPLTAKNDETIKTVKHYFKVPFGTPPKPDQKCSHSDCRETAAAFLEIWQNAELPVEQFPLFPKDEWAYLDALDEGNGNVSFVVGENEQEAWKAYQEILSGNFSRVKDLSDRSRIAYHYSSDPDTGRCLWRYLLMDVNHDGENELLVRCQPNASDYKDFEHAWGRFVVLSYENGWISLRFLGVLHESFVPLKTGQMIFMDDYGGDWYLVVGQLEGKIGEKIGKNHNMLPLYALRKDCQEDGGYLYFYSQDCSLQGEHSSEEISQEEWEEKIEELQKQLIPDDEWFPASVFLPSRNIEGFSVG